MEKDTYNISWRYRNGDPSAVIIINNLNQVRKEYSYADGDRPLFFIHAIRYLCACEKDRSSDLLKI